MIAVLVLAAGLSRRMGDANKLLLPWRGKTIFETVVDALVKVKDVEIIIVAGEQTNLVKTLFPDPFIQIIYNARFKEGMTSSIQAGVGAAGASAAGYMICLADMPFIRTEEYQLLANAFEEEIKTNPKTIIIPVFQNKKGNPVIFSAHYKSQILTHTESEGCKKIVQNAGGSVKLIDMPSANILKDIDVPEDYYNYLISHNLPDV